MGGVVSLFTTLFCSEVYVRFMVKIYQENSQEIL